MLDIRFGGTLDCIESYASDMEPLVAAVAMKNHLIRVVSLLASADDSAFLELVSNTVSSGY